MKKHLFVLLSVLFCSNIYSQSIPNGGFESWQVSNFENLQYYQTSNTEEKNEGNYPPNAIKTTDAYHGNYALRLNTVPTTGTYVAFAFFANGSPGSSSGSGGIPYSQKPTGIRFYYKANIIGNDTAIFLCTFKKNGVPIGEYMYKFAASKTNYTLFNANFTLPQNPDSMFIAAASSNAFLQSGFQPGNFLQIDSITLKGVISQPNNFNGDFENWVTGSDYKLTGWNAQKGTQRTTDAYSGNYAIELQSTGATFGNQPTAGRAMIGTPTPSSTIGGTPFSNQVDTFVFYYKYLPADPNDSARFSMNFKKNGTYFAGYSNLLGISASYKKCEIPINLSMAPDSMIIFLESSKWPFLNSYVGSDLKVDNFYIKSQTIPISNFSLPIFGCAGQPIQLTDISGNMPNAWGWIMPGGSPGSSTSQDPVVTYYSPGTKTITMVANNQFGSGAVISKTISIFALPNVASSSTVTPCGGSNVVLTASGAGTYTWSTGATTPTISVNPGSTTIYTVVGTTNGCTNSAVSAVVVPAVPKPDICMVTVDSANVYNEIYWEQADYPSLDSMIIYREVISNIYRRIGAVPKNAISMFVDTVRSVGPANGDPNLSTYRYKIQVRDTCGQYGPKSLWHNTVYFTHTLGTFFWTNNYMIEGPVNPVQTYSLMVCPNPTASTTYSLVGTTTGNQSTLNDPFYPFYSTTADWRVFADLGYVCNATMRTTVTKATKSRSNVQNNRMIGINEAVLSNKLKVYPNPTHGDLTIELKNMDEDADVNMNNVLGQNVYSEKVNKGITSKTINISSFAKGVYTLTVSSTSGKAVFKIVVE